MTIKKALAIEPLSKDDIPVFLRQVGIYSLQKEAGYIPPQMPEDTPIETIPPMFERDIIYKVAGLPKTFTEMDSVQRKQARRIEDILKYDFYLRAYGYYFDWWSGQVLPNPRDNRLEKLKQKEINLIVTGQKPLPAIGE